MNKILFLLEDNLELSSRIERMAEQCGFRTITARCIEDAKRICPQHENVEFALIDIMVPNTQAELREVDGQLDERNAKASLIENALTDADRKKFLTEMSSIDATTRRLIDSEGGVKFLESPEAQNLRQQGVRVAIFSAQKKDPNSLPPDSIQERIKQSLNGNILEVWFEKPVSLKTLREWISSTASQSFKI